MASEPVIATSQNHWATPGREQAGQEFRRTGEVQHGRAVLSSGMQPVDAVTVIENGLQQPQALQHAQPDGLQSYTSTSATELLLGCLLENCDPQPLSRQKYGGGSPCSAQADDTDVHPSPMWVTMA